MLDLNKIKADAAKDFETTWVESAKLLPRNTKVMLKGKGKFHPVRDMMEYSRKLLVDLGYTEIENRSLIPDSDVYKQYGPEAPVILDRAFYLATIPRPDIGLSKEKIAMVESIIGEFNPQALQNLLRDYKKGAIEGDNVVEAFVTNLKIKQEQATSILQNVFPELRALKPVPSDMTLRSHMTGAWYYTLAAMQETAEYPLALFAVGPRYRNEQREDEGHLKVHHSASIVVMSPEMSLEAGRELTKDILKKYGFAETKFETKKATSKYYASQQEEEVFVKHNGKWLEIADIGMYSPISLANFGIRYPVFNAGFGIERLVMVLGNHDDIRKLVYPQFYGRNFSDQEVADAIVYIKQPETPWGKGIAKSIEEVARAEKDRIAPCRVTAYEDDKVKVELVETEEGKKLIGPAGMNFVCVREGNIYPDITASGIYSGKTYISGIANEAAYEIERGNLPLTHKVKVVRSLTDINLRIPQDVRNYMEGQKKRFGIKGYTFVEIQANKPNKEGGL